MSLPKKFDDRLRTLMNRRAAWPPGVPVDLGAIVSLKNGVFTPVDSLSDHGVTFKKKIGKASQLSLSAQGVRETLFQGNASVPSLDALAANAKARLRIEFTRSDTYFLRTPKLTTETIGDLKNVGRVVARNGVLSNFQQEYIVWQVMTAEDFVFLASKKAGTEVTFSGDVSAMEKLMDAGITAEVSVRSSRNLEFTIKGEGGPVAIGVTRIGRDGTLRDI